MYMGPKFQSLLQSPLCPFIAILILYKADKNATNKNDYLSKTNYPGGYF